MRSKIGIAVIVFLLLPLASARAGQDDLRNFTDQAGRSITIQGRVDKIVTTFKPATLCLLSLGLEEKLVGIDTSSKRDRLVKAVFPGLAKVAGVGSKTMGINFETLVSLKPDLVILYAQKDGMKMADQLADLGIPAMIILPETFATIKDSLDLIALAAGTSDSFVDAGRHMDEILGLIESRLKNLPQNLRKTGYFASALGLFNTTTGNMLQHEIFTAAGIRNVSADLRGYFQDISPEQLVRWNPDIMVLSQHMKRSEAKKLTSKALVRVGAISNRQLYRCPSDLAPWDFPSPLSVLASLWLAQKVYPEQFSDIDLDDRINTFHKALFGLTMEQMGGSLDDKIRL